MKEQSNRRAFLKRLGMGSVVAAAAPAVIRARSSHSRLRLAGVGVGGKGWTDLGECALGHDVVAICDVDEHRLERAAQRYPGARKYTDWRKLLEQKDIDALTISTPDHMHAAVSYRAMSLGKHVYTQKPLTHSVHEARALTRLAKEKGVVTQMGIQHHSLAPLRTGVQVVRDGIIGKVREAHVWTNRPGTYWKQEIQRPSGSDPVPGHVHWDLWLGVAPERPYVDGDVYHPFHWRGWWDFGTGALGDMGCHLIDPAINALELGPPSTVRAEGTDPLPESAPRWSIVHYEFPGTRYTTPTLPLTWYEAGMRPPRQLYGAPDDWPGWANGNLLIGEKGNLLMAGGQRPILFPLERFADYVFPTQPDESHYTQWVNAILGKDTASTDFSYSGPLTETVLLGNVAFRTGKKLKWDSANLKADGVPEADRYLRRPYRKGWETEGL